jgi:hypothetical protein
MKGLKSFRTAWKIYSLAGAVVLTALLGLAGAGIASGHLSPERVRAVRAAAFRAEDPPAASGSDAPAAPADPAPSSSPEGAATSASPAAAPVARPPTEILREIELASEDLRTWEDRIGALGSDLKKNYSAMGEKDQSFQVREKNWDRLGKAMVPLLNELLAGDPGWKRITEEDFAAFLSGDSAAAGRSPVDALESLRRRDAGRKDGEKALRDLPPDVLAGVLATELSKRDAGGSREASGEAEVVRLIRSLEPAKVAKVFKALREENPERAADLFSLLLKGSEGAATPGDAGRTVERSEADGSKAGEGRQG